MKKQKIDELEEIEPESIAEDIYEEEYREELVENDEISLEEEAFLKGYDEAY